MKRFSILVILIAILFVSCDVETGLYSTPYEPYPKTHIYIDPFYPLYPFYSYPYYDYRYPSYHFHYPQNQPHQYRMRRY